MFRVRMETSSLAIFGFGLFLDAVAHLWYAVRCGGLCSFQQNEDVLLEIRWAHEI